MTEAEFRALAAQGYNRIPLVLESFADLDTPLSLYVKLAQRAVHVPARIGRRRRALRPLLVHRLAGEVRIRARGTRDRGRGRGGSIVERHDGDPLAFVGEFMRRYRAAPRPGLPRFCGGLAGYFGYDTVRHIETKLAGHGAAGDRRPRRRSRHPARCSPKSSRSSTTSPGKIYADRLRRSGGARRVRATRSERLQALRRKLREPVTIPFQTAATVDADAKRIRRRRLPERRCGARRNTSRPATSCRSCCRSGCALPFASSPLSLYRALRSLNPSPYMFYYDFGDFHVVGASPEILVRKEGATVTLRPIAGTRPRGATRDADDALARGAARRSRRRSPST